MPDLLAVHSAREAAELRKPSTSSGHSCGVTPPACLWRLLPMLGARSNSCGRHGVARMLAVWLLR